MAITTILQGGIGNQMFQYAMGLAQARALNVKLQLDATRLGGKRPLNLGQWSLTNLILTTRQEPTIIERGMPFNPGAYSVKDGDVLQGYWQSERYFGKIENELRQIFTPFAPLSERAQNWKDQIQHGTSVAIHVRRGDYLIEPHKSFHGNLEWQSYYKPATDYIRQRVENPTFYIFTDEPEWVEENWYVSFSLGEEVVVKPGREAEDIYLMSLCKHAVIANSSFSWWGAWLGNNQQDRVVIAPNKWFDQGNEDYSDIVPDRWIKL